jgi:hypothetical protein
VALALQWTFFRLQTSEKAVLTEELTEVLDYRVFEIWSQQDVPVRPLLTAIETDIGILRKERISS